MGQAARIRGVDGHRQRRRAHSTAARRGAGAGACRRLGGNGACARRREDKVVPSLEFDRRAQAGRALGIADLWRHCAVMPDVPMARTRLTFCDQCLPAIFVVIIGGSCSAAAEDNVTTTSDIEQRVERIINGLRPAVDIAGEAPKKLKLIERMNDLHVPGVSIAVIHGGAVEWARGFGVAATGGPPVSLETM